MGRTQNRPRTPEKINCYCKKIKTVVFYIAVTNFEPLSNTPFNSAIETTPLTLLARPEDGEFTDKEAAIMAEVASSNYGATAHDIQMIQHFFRANRRSQ